MNRNCLALLSRKTDSECSALTVRAGTVKLAAMQFDNILGQIQAQTCTDLIVSPPAALPKLLEKLFPLLKGNSSTGILNRQLYHVLIKFA